MVLPFWCQLTWFVIENRPLNDIVVDSQSLGLNLVVAFCFHTGPISLCVDLFVFICVYFVCFCLLLMCCIIVNTIGTKFCNLYRKSGSTSKNMTSDFAPEVASRFVQTLESPGIKMLRFPGLESPGEKHRSWKTLEKSWNSKVVVPEILISGRSIAN